LWQLHGPLTGTGSSCVWVSACPPPLHHQMHRLKQHPHANVVACVAPAFRRPGRSLCLPMELCAGGSVIDVVMGSEGRGLSPAHTLGLLRQAAAGLEHCHRSGVFHLDVKPDNLLLGLDGCLKVADFGCAAIVPGGGCRILLDDPTSLGSAGTGRASPAVATPLCDHTCGVTRMRADTLATSVAPGTTEFAAPEVLACRRTASPPSAPHSSSSRPATPRAGASTPPVGSPCAPSGPAYNAGAADVWALGVSTYVMLTAFFPWSASKLEDERYMYWWLACEEEDHSPRARMARLSVVMCRLAGKDLPLPVAALLARMLSPSPEDRPTMQEVACESADLEIPYVRSQDAPGVGADGGAAGAGGGCGAPG
jgi:serine/threonine protein kinase